MKLKKYGFEIEIGDQSNENFWSFFFKKHGNIDIVLDDGGHTNLDQIITTVNVIDKINDNGLLIIEDTQTSYLKEYNSNIRFSFINFTKKLIDKINLNNDCQFKKLIYSMHYFNKMVIFRINRNKSKIDALVSNLGQHNNIENLTWLANELNINFIKIIFSKIPFFSFRKITKIIKNRINNNKIKKYFD